MLFVVLLAIQCNSRLIRREYPSAMRVDSLASTLLETTTSSPTDVTCGGTLGKELAANGASKSIAVLIIGGTGGLGSNIVRQLTSDTDKYNEYIFHCISRKSFHDNALPDELEFPKCGAEGENVCPKHIVLNAAGSPAIGPGENPFGDYLNKRFNAQLDINVVKVAKWAFSCFQMVNCHFVHASTTYVMNNVGLELPGDMNAKETFKSQAQSQLAHVTDKTLPILVANNNDSSLFKSHENGPPADKSYSEVEELLYARLIKNFEEKPPTNFTEYAGIFMNTLLPEGKYLNATMKQFDDQFLGKTFDAAPDWMSKGATGIQFYKYQISKFWGDMAVVLTARVTARAKGDRGTFTLLRLPTLCTPDQLRGFNGMPLNVTDGHYSVGTEAHSLTGKSFDTGIDLVEHDGTTSKYVKGVFLIFKSTEDACGVLKKNIIGAPGSGSLPNEKARNLATYTFAAGEALNSMTSESDSIHGVSGKQIFGDSTYRLAILDGLVRGMKKLEIGAELNDIAKTNLESMKKCGAIVQSYMDATGKNDNTLYRGSTVTFLKENAESVSGFGGSDKGTTQVVKGTTQVVFREEENVYAKISEWAERYISYNNDPSASGSKQMIVDKIIALNK